MRFQEAFEGSGLFTGTKGNGGFDSPGAIFGGVRDLPGIMGKETGIQILRWSSVMAGIIGFAYKNVDIIKVSHSCGLPGSSSSGFASSYAVIRSPESTCFWLARASFETKLGIILEIEPGFVLYCVSNLGGLPGRSSKRIWSVVEIKPGFARWAMPWQASFSTAFRTKPGGGGGSRTRVRK
jgi:hypothetical protein